MSNLDKTKAINLVADIGGTNIRLAITEDNKLSAIITYQCAEFPSLIDVIRQFTMEVFSKST